MVLGYVLDLTVPRCWPGGGLYSLWFQGSCEATHLGIKDAGDSNDGDDDNDELALAVLTASGRVPRVLQMQTLADYSHQFREAGLLPSCGYEN